MMLHTNMTTRTEKWYATIHKKKNCLAGSENLQRDSFELSKREFCIKELIIESLEKSYTKFFFSLNRKNRQLFNSNPNMYNDNRSTYCHFENN
jgi:hypothetical protein